MDQIDITSCPTLGIQYAHPIPVSRSVSRNNRRNSKFKFPMMIAADKMVAPLVIFPK
jgi:hypothetical protein